MRIFSDAQIQRGSVGGAEGELCSVLLTLTESAASDHVWEIRLEAKGGGQAAAREVGRVLTRSPAAGSPHSRVLAIACAPGATDWLVEARHISGASPAYCEAEIEITACPYPVDEAWRVVHGFDASAGQRYRLLSGTLAGGPNLVNVPAGMSIHTIGAWLDMAGAATVAWTDPTTGVVVNVPLPLAGLTLGPRGTLWGPLTVGFTLGAGITGGYTIEGLW
jgi:hypothetical protein